MKYLFPKNFLFGGAMSGPQSEGYYGKSNKNIWDYWFEADKNKFYNGIGPKHASMFYKNYKEDIKTMRDIGHNSFRTSIQWSRVLKDFETSKLDEDGIEFYGNMIDELVKNGIEPVICLFHFDMPLKLQEIGGFENKEVLDMYSDYARSMFNLYGEKVKKWITFNEPVVVAECGYLYKFHYPCIVDFKRAVQVGYNINIAGAKAVREFKKTRKSGDIGIVLNLTPSYPRDLNNIEDVKAADICDLIFNRSFLDASIKGEFPKEIIEFVKNNDLLPDVRDEEIKILKENTVTFLGVNYYQPRRVKCRETKLLSENIMPESFFEYYDMPGKIMNPYRGWEIYYKCIYDIAKNIRDNYGNIKWMVTENGMGVEGEERFIKDGLVCDDYRIEFVKEHLKWLHKAIEEGANCFGYHMWAFLDCWSWLNSYKNRYGFIRYNLDTGKRSVKKSGYWMKKVIENKGFEEV